MNTLSLSKDEAIRRIELLGGMYDPESNLDVIDQLFACESLQDSSPLHNLYNIEEKETNENGNGNGSINGGYKRTENTQLPQSKHKAIAKLKECNYRTNPVVTASLLEELFREYPSKSGHWFYIAQHWPPRRINQVIRNLIKLDFLNNQGIHNPAAYFTFLIKKRTRRKAVYGIDKI